ncbi:MAG TPA: type I DNA topoisomerase [candidate division Zixibacteria bacterium]|nr:type I DNA topoisomerase [candidate division Zixibacteria bacterium]MDM7972943.1 type I DNA topoisomerase [candidate division Zixibacteria bacterium]HOD65301.1 type I DNA topoisomerase [candidate division Zixibacteria bacterium]HPM36218.1 type I DNA topoisomerase [candidate division Zixibacteria bacterium]
MAKNLVIVESPAKSKTLARFLGKDFDIMATIGHVMDLPKSKLGVDVKNNFQPDYTVIEGKQKVITELKKAAKKAETVYLAPDPDREGEAIAWHVANSIGNSHKAKFRRVTFNEITKGAVLEAIANPREIDMNLVNAQQARRVLDRIVGYTVSPFLWKTVARNLSAGRVQSVALRLVCEREAEINAFVSQEYWQLTAELETAGKERLEARLYKIGERSVVKPGDSNDNGNKMSIGSENEVRGYMAELEKESWVVAEIKNTERIRRPSAPFITSTLQQEAAKAFGFSPKVTMRLAQELYEGVDIGQEGPTGLITYMRTDSTRIANEALKAARELIARDYGKAYLPPKPQVYSKKQNAQDAHEAIRPTYLALPPDKVKRFLNARQFKLYSLIWNRFVASQMNPARYDVETIDIAAGRFLFRAAAQRLTFDGYLKIYHEEVEADDNGNGNGAAAALPRLAEKDPLRLLELRPNQSFTKPPARYSEAALVKRLEADGIGRPSTYASIISTLRDRKYVKLEQRKLAPTELGLTVNKILVENLPKLFNVKFTAEMEKELDLIEDGTDDWVKVLNEFYEPFKKSIEVLKGRQKEIKEAMTEETDIKCEKCGSPMVIKWGRNGRFLACSAYPECKSTRPLPEEEAARKTDEVCEKCGAPMVIKTGRFGRFLACSAYPNCKNTKAITLGIACPQDGCKGQLVEKRTRGGKIFYGCSAYPSCKFATWDKPVPHPCPHCAYPFLVAKESKAKGEYLQCPRCKAVIAPDSVEAHTPAH